VWTVGRGDLHKSGNELCEERLGGSGEQMDEVLVLDLSKLLGDGTNSLMSS
jgi:hypothetical protein